MKRIFIAFFGLLISDVVGYNVYGQIGLGGGGGGGVAGGNFGMPKVDISNIIPKTPQADQLIKINEVSVNMARGIPNISYNLYTAKVGNLSIPITLNYDASGIKVDDVPGAVGLKWVLSAGGEVARSINGRPDETGYFSNSNTYTSNYFASLNYGYGSVQDLMNSIATNSIDISHDQYSYNYLDKSGDFFFKNYNFIDGKNPNTVKIQTSNFSNLQDFTIADDHGNKAYFGNYNEVTFPSYGGQGYVSPNVPSDGITAWKLNTLTDYTGEQATFNYQNYSYSFNKLLSQAYTNKVTNMNEQYACNCGSPTLSDSYLNCTFNSYLVSGIHTPNEDVFFYYSTNNLNTFNKQLDSIVVIESSYQSVIKRIHFHYDFYLGVNYLRLKDVWNISSDNSDSTLIVGVHYNFNQLPGPLTLSRDIFNYNNGASNATLISSDASYYTQVYPSADRSINPSYTNLGNIDTLYYATGGKVCFYFSPNIIGNISGPGVKIDSISYYNNDNTLSGHTFYSYSNPTNGYTWLSSYVNNITYPDDYGQSTCTVQNINSEIPILSPPVSPFYYTQVEIRKQGSNSPDLLIKEDYTSSIDIYQRWQPYLSSRTYYRNANYSDIVKTENYTYNFAYDNTNSIDWIHPADGYFPNRFYDLIDAYGNSYTVDNSSSCNTLYSSVASYGPIAPRTALLVKEEDQVVDQLNSQAVSSTVINNVYNNYWQKSSVNTADSKGRTENTDINYLYSNSTGSLQSSVINNNLFGLVNQTNTYINNTQTIQNRVNYNIQANGLVLPDTYYIQNGNNSEFVDKAITSFDLNGNILEIENKGNAFSSFVRDYHNDLVVAAIQGAKRSECAYTSFEADGQGGWTFGTNGILSGDGITGNKYYNIANNTISISGLNSSLTYTLTYWIKNNTGGLNIGGTPLVSRNNWTLYQVTISNSTSITISGSGGYIDELRLYPKIAQMITYTYLPQVGITSECDSKNKITYYEYDGQGRLIRIRDQDKNIIKTFDYKYQQLP